MILPVNMVVGGAESFVTLSLAGVNKFYFYFSQLKDSFIRCLATYFLLNNFILATSYQEKKVFFL